jgi:8-hydroxy-5-deazaflavin:NADPH oxidoreductase
MKITVLGTGMVGNAIATKLVNVGHQVMMGSRNANSDAGREWLLSVSGKAQIGTFADAAKFGEIVFDCTNGANSLAALRQAGAANLHAKILIQVGNPLDASNGINQEGKRRIKGRKKGPPGCAGWRRSLESRYSKDIIRE